MTKERWASEPSLQTIFFCATALLARREHSVAELETKLSQKGYAATDIADVITECQRLGLQDNARFTESRCRIRIRQGYGPRRIQQELINLGICREIIQECLGYNEEKWITHGLEVWRKKYGELPETFAIEQKQKQFLLYRGFEQATINAVFKYLKS